MGNIDGIGNYLVISRYIYVYLAKDDTVLGERVRAERWQARPRRKPRAGDFVARPEPNRAVVARLIFVFQSR